MRDSCAKGAKFPYKSGGNGGAYVSQLTHMVRILTSSRLRKPCRYANKNIIMLQTLIRPRYNKKFGINITTRAEYSPRESCERIKLQRFPKSASRAMHGPRAFAIAHADAEAGPRAFAGSRASAIGARGRRGWAARLRHRPCGRRGRTARLRQAARLRRLARRGRRGSCRLPSPARPPSPSHTRTSSNCSRLDASFKQQGRQFWRTDVPLVEFNPRITRL